MLNTPPVPPLRRKGRPLSLALAAAVALSGFALAPTAAFAASTGERTISDATFLWGINNESNGGAYFGGCNFLSAGKAGNTGSARVWKEADGFYSAHAGNVTIEKPNADGAFAAPSWSTKCQNSAGKPVNGKTNNQPDSVTDTRVRIENGTGTVDPSAGTAEITWNGDFTVAYYGGMTYWSASDPKLTVAADGTGTLTASLSGYGTDMDNQELWEPITPRDVTIGTLTGVQVTDAGFTVTPDYLGVSFDDGGKGRNAQAELTDDNRSWWGAFPQEFNDFHMLTGQSSYWYTTDGTANSIQPRKATLPLQVQYSEPAAPEAPAAPAAPTVHGTATGALTATWKAPKDGGSAITGYKVTATASSGTVTEATAPADATAFTTGVLAPGEAYTVTVTAQNAVGETTSQPSAAVVANPNPTPQVTVTPAAGLNPNAEQKVTVKGTGFTGPAAQYGAYLSIFDASVWQPGTTPPAADTWLGRPAWVRADMIVDGAFTSEFTIPAGTMQQGASYGITTMAAHGLVFSDRRLDTFSAVSAVYPIAVPAAPAQPTAQVSDETGVRVAWDTPSNEGGAPISGYRVTLTGSDDTTATQQVGANDRAVVFADLARGVSYTATVAAQNAGGFSDESAASAAAEIAATAPETPAAPVIAAAGVTDATVTWSAPANGGSAITGYTVTLLAGDSEIESKTVSADTFSTSFSGLTRATDYTVMVQATNAIGTSAASAATELRTLATAPDALAAPTATPVSGTDVLVGWVAPVSDGGSAVTGYIVTVQHAGTTVAEVAADAAAQSATVTGLTAGTEYSVTVRASNATGSSAASPATTVRTFATPEKPAVRASLEGTAGVSVAWDAPANGGTALTGYRVELLVDGKLVSTQQLSADRTQAVFPNLTPGTTYTAQVRALNAVGSSESGVSATVTVPAIAPAAPAAPSITGTGDAATVRWVAPGSTGGATISGYTVTLQSHDGKAVEQNVAGDVTQATFKGLAEGTYTASVTAQNAAGTSPASAASDAVALAGPQPEGTPDMLGEGDFTETSSGVGMTVSADGRAVTIRAGADHANRWVGVSVHSEAEFVGWYLADATGTVTAQLPKRVGAHHVAAYAQDGTAIGYLAYSVTEDGVAVPGDGKTPGTGTGQTGKTDAKGAGLARTGGQAPIAFGVLALSLVALGGTLIVRRRRETAAE
ncbi:fibronectin type III domain-containing protein [Leucobacter sp. 1207-22]|uniref:fibronectin type III domain-containing protein n=1 Tax=Leucobacter sp. 1207-22 TaxID=2604456 RepID=UPI00406320D2